MEPIISKLQEGVKYPRFERDATTIINDLVEHITKERGVYSSSIEPNPNEHKVWFNTNNNTLNIYENSRWNTISGQGGGGSSSGAIINSATINDSTINMGTISGATISGGSLIGSIAASGTTTIDMKYGVIQDVCINRAILQNDIYASNSTIVSPTISGGTISGANIKGATINAGYLAGSIAASGATINGGNINGATLGGINVTSGSINYASINSAYISGGTLTGTINATNATISGGNINVDKIKASGIETPLIEITSGNKKKSIMINGDNYIFYGKLADSTLFHSIDLVSGSIAGLTSIKTLSYTGLTIEPYDETGTGTPITIHGKAAGLSLSANSTAPFTLNGISSLNWKNGNSNGYMMTFNTNNNTINSNFDSFNITNGNIKLTSGLINGSANVNLTLSGTISSGTISGATINNCIIDNKGHLYHGNNILVTYTGASDKPVLIPYGGIIGYNSASLTLCGVTLTGGDFTKLKNLQ